MALRGFLGLAVPIVLATGCVAQDPAQTTFPDGWGEQPQEVSGPPGGAMDPGYGYQPPQVSAPYDQYPTDENGAPGTIDPSANDAAVADPAYDESASMPEPSEDPQDPGYVMGTVDDAEIDATLDGYGTWEETDDYGRVWRPDTTVVGVDFTPYETCGSWVWSDYGWDYTCDWSWGWLPFHYGRWGWFDGYWGWVPGYEWGPAWVEWRDGGDYVGWRPLGPTIRDHRGEHPGPTIHDHRATAHDAHWRFANRKDFGRGHIRGHLLQNPAEGLRVTRPVVRPNVRGNYSPVSSASLMRARLSSRWSRQQASAHRMQPGYRDPRAQQGWRSPGAVRSQPQGWRSNEQPTWRPRAQPQPTWRQPGRASQPTWRAPQQGWRTPPGASRPSWSPPSRPSWSPPSRPSWSPPSRPSSPPSRSWGGGSSWGGSRSSGGGGFHPSGGGFHSSGGSRSSGGGGHSSGGGFHSSGGSRSSGGGGRSGGGHRR
jgi:Family of unknown function (DUF6600)